MDMFDAWWVTQRGTKKEESMDFDVVGFLKEKGLEVVDKREAGGALWVVGGQELAPAMEQLKARGISFTFSQNGGRASKHRPAWFTKWKEAQAT
jgi:predicted peroxiredoxin